MHCQCRTYHPFHWLVAFLLVLPFGSFAQEMGFVSPKFDQAKEFEKLGRFDDAAQVYKTMLEEYPYSPEIQYNWALCEYRKKEYTSVLNTLPDLIKNDSSRIKYYRLLGNCYDVIGENEKAEAIYQAAINHKPREGEFYLDLGIIDLIDGNLLSAINHWEDGIAADPLFPDNYYWAAKMYSKSDQNVWALVYGEHFMNLEKSSGRFVEMSRLIYDLYLEYFRRDSSRIEFHIDRKQSNLFADQFNRIYSELRTEGKLAPLDGTPPGPKKVSPLITLSQARESFLSRWVDEGGSANKVKLIDWQKQMQQRSQFYAYNHWLFSNGNPQQFSQWYNLYKEEYTGFVNWLIMNPLPISYVEFFDRKQFDREPTEVQETVQSVPEE